MSTVVYDQFQTKYIKQITTVHVNVMNAQILLW